MIVLHLARLEKQDIDLEGDEDAAFLEIPGDAVIQVTGPVHYQLHAALISGEILVKGSVRCKITGECGRCLEPVQSDAAANEVCLIYEADEEKEEIDITEDIREEMLLALPMSLLCSEDCAGLCPGCGANLNQEKCRCKKSRKTPPPAMNAWSELDKLKELISKVNDERI